MRLIATDIWADVMMSEGGGELLQEEVCDQEHCTQTATCSDSKHWRLVFPIIPPAFVMGSQYQNRLLLISSISIEGQKQNLRKMGFWGQILVQLETPLF